MDSGEPGRRFAHEPRPPDPLAGRAATEQPVVRLPRFSQRERDHRDCGHGGSGVPGDRERSAGVPLAQCRRPRHMALAPGQAARLLPRLARDRPLRGDRHRWRRLGSAGPAHDRLHPVRDRGARRHDVPPHAGHDRLLRGALRRAVPVGQVPPVDRAQLRRRRHGEHVRHDLRHLVRPHALGHDRGDHRPRADPPVVWRSRHLQVVGAPVAERGVGVVRRGAVGSGIGRARERARGVPGHHRRVPQTTVRDESQLRAHLSRDGEQLLPRPAARLHETRRRLLQGRPRAAHAA